MNTDTFVICLFFLEYDLWFLDDSVDKECE